MFKRFSLFAWLLLLSFTASAQLKFTEGTDYRVLKEPVATVDAPTVMEFFWFACGHCYHIQPEVEKWLKDGKPENVVFEQIPAQIGNPIWDLPARAFYVMQALKLDAADDYFAAIHKGKQRDLIGSEKGIKKYFISKGFSEDAVEKAWTSFDVEQKLKRAKQIFERSGLEGVPAFIVNGKYVVEINDDIEKMFELINNLSQRKD